uniref:Phosphomevalonate kinase n=1 Tax=Macrostomum lignano TaxID=282301 RepID=A0A1I8GE39_9PLAT
SASNCSLKPRQLLLISGKRKSGKDHVTSRILAAAAERNFPAACVRVSQPLKAEYARLHQLDADRLADSTEYKEAFRADMIAWGERLRAADPGCFCRLAVQMAQPPPDGLWVVSDVRRPTDIQYFLTRTRRGWAFVPGVDDAESECALDSWERWDSELDNSGGECDSEIDRWIDLFVDRLID